MHPLADRSSLFGLTFIVMHFTFDWVHKDRKGSTLGNECNNSRCKNDVRATMNMDVIIYQLLAGDAFFAIFVWSVFVARLFDSQVPD